MVHMEQSSENWKTLIEIQLLSPLTYFFQHQTLQLLDFSNYIKARKVERTCTKVCIRVYGLPGSRVQLENRGVGEPYIDTKFPTSFWVFHHNISNFSFSEVQFSTTCKSFKSYFTKLGHIDFLTYGKIKKIEKKVRVDFGRQILFLTNVNRYQSYWNQFGANKTDSKPIFVP